MLDETTEETFVDEKVTYTLEMEGRFIIVEHVPARVSSRTGEHFFAPSTVAHIQKIIWEKRHPARIIEAPVFEYEGAA